MPVTTNQIGTHTFIALHGNPMPPQTRLELDVRPGVQGITVTQVGKHGTPFRLISQVDLPSYEDARDKLIEYLETIEDDPVVLIQGGHTSSADGYLVQVLNVEQIRCIAIRQAMGGLNDPSLAWLECAWDLVAIETGVTP